jgi:predicted acylesterase/phospholipase RssA
VGPLRIYLTLSGGASLGAYEAGAASGVCMAVRRLQSEESVDASVDAVGGASAGAIVGLFASYALTEGLDPVELLHEAWVERVSLEVLRSSDSRAPLSFDELRERIPDLLDPANRRPAPAGPQERPIAFHAELTGLQGLTYPIAGLRRERPVAGATYADWGRFELHPRGGMDQVIRPPRRSPLDFVLASAASPGGFAPQLLDRSLHADCYRPHGIRDFPESGHLWYTDGGMVGSQPLGRVIAAGEALHGSEEEAFRLQLLVNPRSEVPAGGSEWADPDHDPSWQEGLSRALAILSEQGMFDDLRRIEKDNTRLEWIEALVRALEPELKRGAKRRLRELLERIDSDRHRMRTDEPGGPSDRERPGDDAGVAELMHAVVEEVAGVARKQLVEIDVISPLVLSERGGADVPSLLAGEFMGDFGGFLSRDLRASDFALGYESSIAWLRGGLPQIGVDGPALERTIDAVERARPYDRDEVRRGDESISDLDLRDRLELVRLGLHMGRVISSAMVASRARIRDRLGELLERARERG